MDESTPKTKLQIVNKRTDRYNAIHLTRYFCTLSSNKHVADLGKEGVNQWMEDVKELFSDVYPLLRVPPNTKIGTGPERQLPPRSKIESIDVKLAFEVGGITNYLHAHATVEIRHRTKVQLNLTLIHSILTEMFSHGDSTSHQYFQAKLIPIGAEEKTENYLNKSDNLIKQFSA